MRYLTIIFLSVLAAQLIARESIPHRTFSIQDGLPSKESYWTYQDDKGDLWVGTDHGVMRYNGREAQVFTTQDGLPDNTVFKVIPDHKGRLWFLTFRGGVCYFQHDSIHVPNFNDSLTRLLTNNREGQMADHVYDLGVNRSGDIYMTTAFHSRFMFKVDRHETITMIELAGPDDRMIYHIRLDNGSSIQGRTSDEKIQTESPVRIKKRSVDDCSMWMAESDWFGSYRTHVHPGSNEPDHYISAHHHALMEFRNGQMIWKYEVGQAAITYIMVESDRLFVCTLNGLFIFQRLNGEYQLMQTHFRSQILAHIFRDNEGIYWLSSVGHGLHRIPSFNVHQFDLPKSVDKSSISTNRFLFNANAIVTHKKNRLYLLTVSGDSLFSTDFRLPGDSSYKFYGVTRDHIVFGPYCLNYTDHELSPDHFLEPVAPADCFHANEERVHKIFPSPISDVNCHDFRNGFVLRHSGIEIFDSRSAGLKIIPSCFSEYPKGTYWIGGMHGLYRLEAGSIHFMGDEYDFLKSRISQIVIGPQGSIWVSTRGKGVAHFNGVSWQQITERDGLASDFCGPMVAQGTTVWVGSRRGLSQIKPGDDGFSIIRYTEKDGLPSNFIAGIADADSMLRILSYDRLTHWPVDAVREAPAPKSRIHGITLGDIHLTLKEFSDTALGYDHRNLSIEVGNQFLYDKDLSKVKYRLLGLYADWTVSGDRLIEFHNLPAGKYVFEAFTNNRNGIWSKDSIRMPFEIRPPWVQTTAFIGSSIVIILFLIGMGINRYVNHVTAQREKQQLLLQSNLTSMKRQINPHFISNALSSVQHFIGRNRSQEANHYLTSFSHLIHDVLKRSDQVKTVITEEIQTLSHYLELEQMRLNQQFQWRIHVDPQIEQDMVQIPAMVLQPLVENAIWHGMSGLDRPGNLEISFRSHNNGIAMIVRDNGHGFAKGPDNSHTSHRLGLKNVEQRLQLINRIEHSRIRMLIFSCGDRYNNELLDHGTIIHIEIPNAL